MQTNKDKAFRCWQYLTQTYPKRYCQQRKALYKQTSLWLGAANDPYYPSPFKK